MKKSIILVLHLAFILTILSSTFSQSAPEIIGTKVNYSGEFAPSEGLIKGPEKETRSDICLNGFWEFQPIYAPYNTDKTTSYGLEAPDLAPDLPLVDQNAWEKTKIKIPSSWNQTQFFPSFPEKWKEAKMGWMRKQFEVPAEWQGRRIILNFEAVSGDCKVFINGKNIGGNFDSSLPFEFDITNELQIGSVNELLIGVRSTELFMHQTQYGKRPFPRGATSRFLGIWQDVHLLSLPEVYISDVFIQPEVSSKLLRAEVTIRNSTNQSKELTLGAIVNEWINLAAKDDISASAINWKLGKESLRLNKVNFTIPANSEKSIEIQTSVHDELKLWDIGQPNLYGITASLFYNGQIADKKYERFGWREFKIEGNKFLVNGKSVQLLGDSQHLRNSTYMSRRFAWSWLTLLRDAGGNAARLHAVVFPRHFHDLGDEMGILILPESSIYGSTCDVNYSSELFWKAARHNVEGMVRKYRNHASVFGWSIENEVLPALNVQTNDQEYKQMVYNGMGELADICRQLDPTRDWISGDGSRDMDGRLPVYLVHYGSTTSYREEAAATDKPFGVGEACIAYYSTPRQSDKYVGDRAYRNYSDHQDAIAIDAYELIKVQREVGIFCSIWNLGFYSVKNLPLGNGKGIWFSKDYVEGKPGMQIEYIPPYSTQYNPGYDPDLPLYQPLPLFHAVKAAYNQPEPSACEWDQRKIYKSPPPPKIDSPEKNILFIGSDNSDNYFKLKNAGLPLTHNSSESKFVLIDCDYEFIGAQAEVISENAKNENNTLIFWGLSPSNIENINPILPLPLEIFEREATSLGKNEDDIRVASIPYKDMYFAENTDSKIIMKYGLKGEFINKGNILLKAGSIDWSTKNRTGKPQDPSFVEFKSENGSFMISTINIDILTPAHIRLISQLFRNMGIEMKPVKVKRGSVFSQSSELIKALNASCYKAPTFKEAFEEDFIGGDEILRPELDVNSNGCVWKVAETKTGLFDFNNIQPQDNDSFNIAYLSFWLHSPKPMDEILADPDVPQVHFEFSASEAIRIKLNEEEIFFSDKKVESGLLEGLPLKKGWNHFLIKVIGSPDEWSFNGKLLSKDIDLLSSMRSALNPYSEKANFSVIKHTDPEIIYDLHWGLQGDGWYESATPGARASFKFNGTGITMTGLIFPKGGKAKLFLDGKFDSVIDYHSEKPDPHGMFYTKTDLPNGEHEIILEVIDGWVALGPFEQWESY